MMIPCLTADGKDQYVDTAYDMKYRGQLLMNLPEGLSLPRGTEVLVDFSVNKTNGITIVVTVPDANNASERATFSFYEAQEKDKVDTTGLVFIDGE